MIPTCLFPALGSLGEVPDSTFLRRRLSQAGLRHMLRRIQLLREQAWVHLLARVQILLQHQRIVLLRCQNALLFMCKEYWRFLMINGVGSGDFGLPRPRVVVLEALSRQG